MRTALIVSPYFPPSTLAGVHRARHLTKHLPASGWWPIVVCVDEAYHEQRLDLELSSLVAQSAEIVKTGAISAKVSRRFGLGDIGLRSYSLLRREIVSLIKSRDVKAVVVT